MTTGTTSRSTKARRPWAAQTRALVWKEWRQQRWVALALLVVLAILTAAKIALLFRPIELGPEIVTFLFVLFLGVSPIVLSANAFCGETDDETMRFLRLLPARTAKLFWVKAAVIWCFCLALLLLVGVSLPLFMSTQLPLGSWTELLHHIDDREFLIAAGLVTGLALSLGVLPALMSSWARRTLPCVIASIIAFAGLGAGFVGAMLFLQRTGILRGIEHVPFIICVPFLIPIAFIAVSRWIWCWGRVERTTGARVRRAALLIALVVFSLGILPVASWSYYTFLAPPGAFKEVGWYDLKPSPHPAGEFVAVNCRWGGWGKFGARAALVDMRNGRAEWLTGFRQSWCGGRSVWSPSGNRLLLSVTDRWLWPFARETGVWTYWVVDARTGRKETLHSLCPDFPAEFTSDSPVCTMGWSDDQTVAFGDQSDARFDIHFVDIEKHTMRVCRSSLDPTNWRVSGGSVFVSVSEERQPSRSGIRVLSLARFAPDLPEPEVISRTISETSAHLMYVDDAGYRLIIRTQESSRQNQNAYYLTAFAPDAPMELLASEMELLASEPAPQSALVPDARGVVDFLPGGQGILLYGEDELILFDIQDRGVCTFPLGTSSPFAIESATLSPTGKRALVRICEKSEPGHYPDRYHVVVDLATGMTWTNSRDGRFQWLGDDKLIVSDYGGEAWVVNYDGSGVRKLFEE